MTILVSPVSLILQLDRDPPNDDSPDLDHDDAAPDNDDHKHNQDNDALTTTTKTLTLKCNLMPTHN